MRHHLCRYIDKNILKAVSKTHFKADFWENLRPFSMVGNFRGLLSLKISTVSTVSNSVSHPQKLNKNTKSPEPHYSNSNYIYKTINKMAKLKK